VDTVLISAWMAGTDALPTIDEASVSAARLSVRAAGAGLDTALVESVALAASELVQNQLRHARRGQFAVLRVARGGVPGLEIIAADAGPGIASPTAALAGSARVGLSAPSLGEGLSAVRRMTQELDLDVRLGEGTCVRARAFAAPVARRREVGILGRGLREEPVSGDHAVFVRDEGALLLAVVDGLGHGPLARDASARAVETLLAHRGSSPLLLLAACDAALAGTRGAVMSAARIDEEAGTIEHAGAGNVTTRVERFRRSRALGSAATTLGTRGVKQKPMAETTAFAPDEALILFTDGLTSRASAAGDAGAFREHPIAIAERLLADYGRDNDDALVLVAR
jgi:anti-sigma regulatory factor (Ser/Thr protein kinase)